MDAKPKKKEGEEKEKKKENVIKFYFSVRKIS